MRYILSDRTVERFVKFGVNILGISPDEEPYEIAEKAIKGMYDFYKSLGMPMTLREVGINDERLEEMAHHIAINEGLDTDAYVPLNEQDILAILKAAL